MGQLNSFIAVTGTKADLKTMSDLDWAVINSRLPYKGTKEQYQMRKKMWAAIDVNDNGYVSKSTKKHADDYLEFLEFRLFLQALRQFFEYYQAFSRLDSGQDGRVSKEEFLSEDVKQSIETWVGPIDDMEAEFAKIDANGGGQILFSEFVVWALEKNLDIEDDIDED